MVSFSLIVQLVKNSPAMQEILVQFLVGKISWRRDRLPTPVFLGFPCGSAGKESACNVGDLGSVPRLGRSPGVRERLPTPVFWPGEFHGLYTPWGCRVGQDWMTFFFFYDSLSLKNKIPIFHKFVPIEPIPLWDIQLNAVHILGYTLSCCLLNRFQTG